MRTDSSTTTSPDAAVLLDSIAALGFDLRLDDGYISVYAVHGQAIPDTVAELIRANKPALLNELTQREQTASKLIRANKPALLNELTQREQTASTVLTQREQTASTVTAVRETEPARYTLIDNPHQWEAVYDEVATTNALALDLETTTLDPHTGRTRLAQIHTGTNLYIIDLDRVPLPYVASAVIAGDSTIIGHNLKFDLRWLDIHGIGIPPDIGRRLIDTYIDSKLLTAGDRTIDHDLAAVTRRHLNIDLDKTAQTSDWSGPLTAEQLRYAAADVAVLPLLRYHLTKQLRTHNLDRIAAIEHRAIPALAWVENTGIGFDAAAHAQLVATFPGKLAEAERLLEQAAGTSRDGQLFETPDVINWGSSQQLLEFLQTRGHQIADTTKETLATLDDPLVRLVLDWKRIKKASGQFGEAFTEHVHPATGRVHAEFHQLGSEAGRMSCSNPNLQQVPKSGEFRRLFKAGEGRVLVRTDYSQIELRIAALLAPDIRLLEVFGERGDLHTVTAQLVLGRDKVAPEDRKAAKALNFGLLYGSGADTFRRSARHSYGVEMTRAEAVGHRSRFFEVYNGLAGWHRRQPSGVVATRTLAGRRRTGVAKFTEKVNTPVQGTGADGLKLALALLHERKDQVDAAPVNVVHDEIVVECAEPSADDVVPWLEQAMLDGMREIVTGVPIEVESTVAQTWGG